MARMAIKEKILQSLQDENLDVEAIDIHGNTLIHQVLLSREVKEKEIIELLQLLLDRGVDPNTKNAREKTVLHFAVEKRMRDAVDMLIERGARKDVINKNGDSIAHHYVGIVHIECTIARRMETSAREKLEMESASFVEFMISRGFDFDRRNNERQSALHRAATNSRLQHILLALLEHARHIVFTREHNRTLLCSILAKDYERQVNDSSRRAKIVKLLLERGVPDETGRAALFTAIDLEEDMNVVQMIGDRLLDDLQCRRCASCLFLKVVATCAWWHNCGTDYFFRMLRALTAKGADVNIKDKYGRSAVHFAVNCRTARCSLIELLVDLGCEVNAKDNRGDSALHVAARDPDNVAAVRTLLECGALVNCKNKDVETPLHLAVKNHGGESIEMTKLLLENGANPNSKDAAGRTALSLAASGWDIEMVMLKVLLRRGACVNARDSEGETALSLALTNFHYEAVKELLKYGADFNDDSVDRWIRKTGPNGLGPLGILKEHCINLKAAGLQCSINLGFYRKGYKYKKSYQECLREIDILKTTFIHGRTSLYDFLHMDIRCRCNCINNKKFREVVDSPVFEQQFPRYAALILASYCVVMAKKLLLERAKEAWLQLTEIPLPDICVERILDYLNDTDLIDMADRDETIA